MLCLGETGGQAIRECFVTLWVGAYRGRAGRSDLAPQPDSGVLFRISQVAALDFRFLPE
jgi:hypothetical protein